MSKYYPYPTRDPINNYFPLPNEVYLLGLSVSEVSVYGFLMSCEDRETHQCYPSYETIGEHTKLSKNTVRKYVKSLCEKRLISVKHTTIVTKSGQKRNGTLLYTIRPIEEAIHYRMEQQMQKAELERRASGCRQSWRSWQRSAEQRNRPGAYPMPRRNPAHDAPDRPVPGF